MREDRPRGKFATRLDKLIIAASSPKLDDVAHRATERIRASSRGSGRPVSANRISAWRTGANVPQSFSVLSVVLDLLIGSAKRSGALPRDSILYDRREWERCWSDARRGRGDRVSRTGGSPWGTADSLPGIDVFIGRGSEIRRLEKLIKNHDSRPSGPVVISAIDGMAGVGKTALAIHVSQRIATRFPDGVLFLDLQGFTAGLEPLSEREATERLLRMVDVPVHKILPAVDERARQLRIRLSGTRTLLLLDNARDEKQVRFLVSSSSGCLTIITSRRRLAGLDGAQLLSVDVLEDEEARELFTTLVRFTRTIADDDTPTVRDIAVACGNLPLALRIAAARFRSRPRWTLQDLAARLTNQRVRLAHLDDGYRSVAAAFHVSYSGLSSGLRRLFRLLGLAPGRRVDAHIAAALADIQPDEAEISLERLVDQSLLQSVAVSRYQLHDLLRAFAQERAHRSVDERTAAEDRLVRYYAAQVRHSVNLIAPSPSLIPENGSYTPDSLVPLASYEEALSWLDGSVQEIVSIMDIARRIGMNAKCWELAGLLWKYFDLRRLPSLQIATTTVGLAAARDDGSVVGEAWMLHGLGDAHRSQRDFAAAISCYHDALSLWERSSNEQARGITLSNLGLCEMEAGELDRAERFLQSARQLHHEREDTKAEAANLNNLGSIDLQRGRFEEAVRYLRGAEVLYDDEIDGRVKANTLVNLGSALRENGDLEGSSIELRRSLTLYRKAGDNRGEAIALLNLGDLLRDQSKLVEAIAITERAVDQLRRIEEKQYQGWALDTLGQCLVALSQVADARNCWIQSVELLDAVGDPHAAQVRSQLDALP